MEKNILIITAIVAVIFGIIGLAVIVGDISGKVVVNVKDIPGKVFHLYSIEEIAKHSLVYNCWIINGKSVYDATMFINVYKEASILEKRCGGNAEQEIRELVPAMREILEEYKIGEISS